MNHLGKRGWRLGLIVVIILAWSLSCKNLYEKDTAEAEKIEHDAQLGNTFPHYTDDFIAQMEKIFVNRPEIPKVLELLKLKEGMVVADIGCANGSYTFPIAGAVGPTGKVYALEIQARFLDILKTKMADPAMCPHRNVIPKVSRADDTTLPADSLDAIWLSQVHFHNFPVLLDTNTLMIKSMFDTLKPGGLLAIGDEAIPDIPDPAPNIIKHYKKAGFILEKGPETDPIIKSTFYLLFRKPAN